MTEHGQPPTPVAAGAALVQLGDVPLADLLAGAGDGVLAHVLGALVADSEPGDVSAFESSF
ncbi:MULTISPECIES: FxSxx-COOH cyclophane-containing RiPP peptide [unclassified Micromonospora]|uniref:FxSxx-COOH cyclophane-containing RiPP peptide n=1 Tax=unclassified Micromonospora TaxID=2617518 RepID=UPI0013156F7F|nr:MULTISPECIES: FxSxx-COOH cyclophane-containing RiPP peptide [unclassified Micromonospora]